MTTHKGFRWNTATAYLRPALSRNHNNLDVESNVLVWLDDVDLFKLPLQSRQGQISLFNLGPNRVVI